MTVTFDVSELNELVLDLGAAPAITRTRLRSVMRRGAKNINRQLAREMGRSRHFKGAAGAFAHYDEYDDGDTLTYEMGPAKGKWSGGNLGNIAYFGTSRGGGTVPDPEGALRAEAPAVIGWIEGIAEGILD